MKFDAKMKGVKVFRVYCEENMYNKCLKCNSLKLDAEDAFKIHLKKDETLSLPCTHYLYPYVTKLREFSKVVPKMCKMNSLL